MTFESIDELKTALQDQLYLADRGLATAIFLSLKLKRPLFLEGEAGVGKTEVAKALARALNTELIRLQCYEGLDVHHAVYEWNYTRQMLHIRMLEARGEQPEEQDLFGSEFLLRRPLLQAVAWEGDRAPVLLIDELDRSDQEFEAFLLEILSEFQVTIPEIGTIRAKRPPIAVITSNRTREVHDALKRRCLYHWIDYPTFQREFDILRLKLPEAPERLTRQVTAFVQKVREADLYKVPGVAESLDWAEALWTLDQEQLDPEVVDNSLGALLKYQEDVLKIQGAEARSILATL